MAEKKKIPEIRFKGFSKDWEENDLFQLVDVRSGRDYKHLLNGNIPVYGTGGYMLSVNEALSYTEDAIGIGRKGTIDKPYILKAPFWTVDTLFYTVPKEKNDLDFIYDVFQKINWKKKDESTGVPSLSKVTINSIQVFIPKCSEQSKIGTYFKQLDTLITLHQRKYDKLVNVKKSMLEKMFPKKGAAIPEIRFKGFTEAWEEKKLGEVVDIVGGGTPSTSIPEYWDGEVDWYSPTEIGQNVYAEGSVKRITELGLQKSSAKVLPPNKTILFTSRAGIGDMAILKYSGATNQGFQSLIISDKNDVYFVYSMGHLIKRYALINASGSTFLEISGKVLGRMDVLMPSEAEQAKIGEFFRNKDKLITLYQRELEKLKNIKKAMLEKMFV
ncbi:MAG: restriction endonuclease subunit S [Mariniphaga sp.]|nr:restriction endonuclease subunit S [Mariniphaga sp.]